MRRLLLALAPSLTIAILAFSGPVGAANQPVSMTLAGFNPPNVTIAVGDTVTWTNSETSSTPHTATANDRSFDSGRLDPGQSYPHKFTTAGSFPYSCTIHPNMIGNVTVQGPATEPPPPPPTSPPPTSKPSPSPSPTKASPSPSPSKAVSPTPSPSAASPTPSASGGPTGTVVATADDDEKKKDGMGIGAIIAIIAGVLAVGSAGGLWYLNRKTVAG